MSQLVFPSLPGLEPVVGRFPVFNTRIQEGVAGDEVRFAYQAYPLWKFSLKYQFLRDDAANNELNKLLAFFMAMRGAGDSFLYTDPDRNSVVDQSIGAGDGVTTQFQLLRASSDGVTSFLEPVMNVNGAPAISRADWQGKQLMYTTARTNYSLYSEQMQQAAGWTPISATITVDAVAAPDGTVTADKIVETAVLTNHGVASVNAGSPVVNGDIWHTAFCVKAAERNIFSLWFDNGAGFGATYEFNVNTQAVTQKRLDALRLSNPVASIVALPAAGWYRIGLQATVIDAATMASIQARCYLGDGGGVYDAYGSPSYMGDVTKGAYLWGGETKKGPLSSYIKTPANAAVTVTDYALGSTGLATFANAPLAAAALTWTGNYYNRCRFMMDEGQFERFMNQLWKLGTCDLKGAPGNKV